MRTCGECSGADTHGAVVPAPIVRLGGRFSRLKPRLLDATDDHPHQLILVGRGNRAIRHHLAGLEDDNPIRDPHDIAHVVADEDDCLAPATQGFDQRQDLFLLRDAQSRGGLVHDDELRR